MKPLEPFPGRTQKWKCECMNCGAVSHTYYTTVQRGGRGCKNCAYSSMVAKKRLSAEEVKAILERAELRAVEDYLSTAKALLCECLRCGNYVSPTLADVKRGHRCEYCRRRKVDPEHAKKLALKAGLKPLEEFKSPTSKWKCLHIKCGEIVYPHWTTLKRGGSGCMKCRGLNTSRVRRIPEKEATSIMKSQGFEPLEPYRSSTTKWRCQCLKCLREVEPTLSNVKNGVGCIYCRRSGLDLVAPAYLYLMSHPNLQAHKIGVGGRGTRSDRIQQHIKRGWVLYRSLDLKSGLIALQVEEQVLGYLFNQCKLNPFLSAEQMPQGGWTETFDVAEIGLSTIWRKILEISKVEE
jgi:hypothetical protein